MSTLKLKTDRFDTMSYVNNVYIDKFREVLTKHNIEFETVPWNSDTVMALFLGENATLYELLFGSYVFMVVYGDEE